MLQSGNHGRSSEENSAPTGIGGFVPSTIPQQSTRGFVAPPAAPVKKTPGIIDIMGEGLKERRIEGLKENGVEYQAPQSLNPSTPQSLNPSIPPQADFSAQWRAMFNSLFAENPLCFSLTESIPTIENNIITFVVQNSFQKDHFESKTRETLEYLRTHYDEKIEDIVIETNQQLKTVKIIYDAKDKYQNFKEQNEEFETSIQILEVTLKD